MEALDAVLDEMAGHSTCVWFRFVLVHLGDSTRLYEEDLVVSRESGKRPQGRGECRFKKRETLES